MLQIFSAPFPHCHSLFSLLRLSLSCSLLLLVLSWGHHAQDGLLGTCGSVSWPAGRPRSSLPMSSPVTCCPQDRFELTAQLPRGAWGGPLLRFQLGSRSLLCPLPSAHTSGLCSGVCTLLPFGANPFPEEGAVETLKVKN